MFHEHADPQFVEENDLHRHRLSWHRKFGGVCPNRGQNLGIATKRGQVVGNTLRVSSSISPASTPVSSGSSAANASSEAMAYPANPYRLPRTALPTRYDLTLSPDLHKRDFLGDARITLKVTEPIAEVVCNSLELEILKAWVVDANGTRIDATATLDVERERVSFALERTLWAGTAVLHVQFHGELNDKLVGFYASTYEAGHCHHANGIHRCPSSLPLLG
jgi:hypothetical protein